jgi:hypothetical protein
MTLEATSSASMQYCGFFRRALSLVGHLAIWSSVTELHRYMGCDIHAVNLLF